MLNRALQANDPDQVRAEITAAIAELRQPSGTYNDLTLHPKLLQEIAKFPTAAAAAAAWGVKRQTLHAAVNGDKPVPPAVLRKIGLELVPAGVRQYREI